MLFYLICLAVEIVLFVTFVIATLTSFAAWVRRAGDAANGNGDDEAVAPNLTALVAWLWQWAIMSAMALGFPLGLFWGKSSGMSPGQRPVVLIHGYGVNRIVWWYFRRRLRRDGYRNIELINLSTLTAGIEVFQQQLSTVIDRLLDESGQNQVDLIGHSMGGLVAVSAWLGLEDGKSGTTPDPRIRKVIAIGSPFEGTTLAFLGLGPAARQMRAGSVYLNHFAKAWKKVGVGTKSRAGAGEAVTSLVSSFDNMVIPWQSGLLTGAKNEEFSWLGHDSMLGSAQIYDAAIAVLTGESGEGHAVEESA